MEFLEDPETWVALGLLILIGIFLWQRVPAFAAAALDTRAASIAKELDEARRLREEAAAILEEYKRKAATAEQEAASILTEAKEESERFATESRAALTAQIERRAQQAKDKIAQAEAHAMAEIRALAADTATTAAETLIAARLDAKRTETLISEGIKDLSGKLN